MADASLQIVAQIRDLASGHLARIGAAGAKAGQQVAAGMGTAQASTGRLGESVLRMGQQFQGIRKLAGGAMAGIGAGLAAANASSETMAQSVLRIGTSLATGFAAGGPVGMALAGAGALIGGIVGKSQQAEEQARQVAAANLAWADSVRALRDAYAEQAVQAGIAVAAGLTGGDVKAALAAREVAKQREALVEGTPTKEGRQAGLLQRQYESDQAAANLAKAVETAIGNALAMDPRRRVARYGEGTVERAQAQAAGGDVQAAARTLAQTQSSAADNVREALKEQGAALERLRAIKEAIAAFDEAQARTAEAQADQKKRDAEEASQALRDQADAMATRLLASEEELRYERETAMVAKLRAAGEEAAAYSLQQAIDKRRAADKDATVRAAADAEEQRTQAIVQQADERARYLGLSKEDQAIASDLAVVEELRRRGQADAADKLEAAVRARQAGERTEREAEQARRQALEDETELLAAQRDLIDDRWERERQAARDRATMAVRGGADAAQAGRVLALDLQRIEQERLRTAQDVNKAAERDLELARAATDAERERIQAQHEYLDNLDRGVAKKTADALLTLRLADIDKKAAQEAAEAQAKADKDALASAQGKRRQGRPPGAPERGVFGAFSSLGAEAMTRREREARERKMAGLPPITYGPTGKPVVPQAAKPAAPMVQASLNDAPFSDVKIMQKATETKQAVEAAAQKVPNMDALPDPTPFVKKAGDELAKVPPAFERYAKANEQYASATADAVDAVGKAAAAAVEKVASSVRELQARVRRVEDRLAAAGTGV